MGDAVWGGAHWLSEDRTALSEIPTWVGSRGQEVELWWIRIYKVSMYLNPKAHIKPLANVPINH